MTLTKKILTNTFWMVLGRVITAFLGIVSIKVITNYLPTDIYGQYTTLYEFIGFFAIAADFGLYTIGVREMAKKEKPEEDILANILSIRIILIILTLGLSILVANLIPKYQGTYVSSGIWLVAITTSLMLLHGTLTSVLQYRLKMLYANIALTIGKILTVSYIVTTIFYISPDNIDKGFTHLLYAGIIGNSTMVLLTLIIVTRYIKVRLKLNWQFAKDILIKAFPLGLSLILSTIYFKLDVILLSLLRDYHETGLYGVSLKFMEILTVIPVFFMNSALPSLTENFRNNMQKFVSLIERSWHFLLIIATPLLIGGVILAFPLTFLISSPQFLSGFHCNADMQIVEQTIEEAKETCANLETYPDSIVPTSGEYELPFTYFKGTDVALKLILIAMFFSFLNTLFTFALISIDKQSLLLVINLIGAAFNVITNLIFIPEYGFIGAAITTIITEIIVLAGTYIAMKKYANFKIFDLTSLKILFSGALMGLTVYLLQPITYTWLENANVLILVPIGGIIYAGSILLTKAINLKGLRS